MACLPACLRFYLIIVRLILSACHWPIITIKMLTGEECCASGVKVFSLTIWLELILWSLQRTTVTDSDPQAMNHLQKWTWLWLRCGGSIWFNWRQFCSDFSVFCINWIVCQTFLMASVLSLSVCRPTCFLVHWCTSAPMLRQVSVLSYFFFYFKCWFFNLDTGVLLKNVI